MGSPKKSGRSRGMSASALGVAAALLGTPSPAEATGLFNLTTDNPVSRVNATNFFKDSNQVLSMPLRRIEKDGQPDETTTPSLAKRFFKTDALSVYGAAYLAEISIGSPAAPQAVDVLIDTGSFELWVDPDCATSNVPDLCTAFGHYDPSQSSTAQSLGTEFKIEYGYGNVSGPYYRDDVYISGAQIQNQQFGVANQSELVWFGIMGLGRGQGPNGFLQYPLIVDSLAAQGYTNSKLFSLDLGGQAQAGAAITGELVFGGVDTHKYSGYLGKVSTDPSDPHYKVSLTSIAVRQPGASSATPLSTSPSSASSGTDPSATAGLPLAVVVDSGTTLSLLPEDMVAALAAQFPGAASDDRGGYTVDCGFRSQDGVVEFGFAGGLNIGVRYADFVWDSGNNQCFLGAWYSGDVGAWILGDTFLRGAYVTFDQDNNALYMAEYTPCGDSSHLVPVPAGPDAASRIPGSCRDDRRRPGPGAGHPDHMSAVPADRAAASPSSSAPASPPSSSPPPQSSMTMTVTRAVVYTPSTCANNGGAASCAPTTRFETVVETMPCPSSSSSSSAPATAAGAAAPTGSAAAAGRFRVVPESRAPVGMMSASASASAAAVSTKELAAEGVGAAAATMTTTMQTSTTVFAVSSCAASEQASCTPGMTSTRVVTLVETVRVVPVAAAASSSAAAAAPSLRPVAAVVAPATAVAAGNAVAAAGPYRYPAAPMGYVEAAAAAAASAMPSAGVNAYGGVGRNGSGIAYYGLGRNGSGVAYGPGRNSSGVAYGLTINGNGNSSSSNLGVAGYGAGGRRPCPSGGACPGAYVAGGSSGSSSSGGGGGGGDSNAQPGKTGPRPTKANNGNFITSPGSVAVVDRRWLGAALAVGLVVRGVL
ncbi:aspartic peptidase domain-containing protein [Xylariaceae sp. FL0804]|nr:aspartic peptidase domain-containing protein [Xylariaceae sp. FL0804]